jgi:hypothetical protein
MSVTELQLWVNIKQTKNEKKEFENPLSEVYSYMLRLSGLWSLFQRLSSQPKPRMLSHAADSPYETE